MIKVSVTVAGSLRSLLGNKTVVMLDGETLEDLINQLATQYGIELKAELLDNKNNIDYIYAIFSKAERLYHLSDKIKDGDEILIIPIFAGG